MGYYCQPCKTAGQISLAGKVRMEVVLCKPDEAEFYGCYRKFEDGSCSWVADFASQSDAVEFCYYRNKEADEY